MPNTLVRTTIPPSSLVSPSSRYIDSPVIYYTDQHRMAFATYRRHLFLPADTDKWTLVTKTEEYRPDKVAVRAYGVAGFWWKIMEANGLKDVWDFKAGTTVWLPSNIF